LALALGRWPRGRWTLWLWLVWETAARDPVSMLTAPIGGVKRGERDDGHSWRIGAAGATVAAGLKAR